MNLNDPYGYLIGNRKAIIDALINKLSPIKNPQEVKRLLLKWKKIYTNLAYGNEYPEYVGILRWYIDKQLRKHGHKGE